jgi:hypothetical protein
LCFIKDNMRCNINSSSQKIKTQKSFVIEAIAKKKTLNRSVLQLIIVVRTNKWVTQATKHSKSIVIKNFFEKKWNRLSHFLVLCLAFCLWERLLSKRHIACLAFCLWERLFSKRHIAIISLVRRHEITRPSQIQQCAYASSQLFHSELSCKGKKNDEVCQIVEEKS